MTLQFSVSISTVYWCYPDFCLCTVVPVWHSLIYLGFLSHSVSRLCSNLKLIKDYLDLSSVHFRLSSVSYLFSNVHLWALFFCTWKKACTVITTFHIPPLFQFSSSVTFCNFHLWHHIQLLTLQPPFHTFPLPHISHSDFIFFTQQTLSPYLEFLRCLSAFWISLLYAVSESFSEEVFLFEAVHDACVCKQAL